MTSLDLDDTLVSYINGRSLGGACCGFLFEGPFARGGFLRRPLDIGGHRCYNCYGCQMKRMYPVGYAVFG